MREIEDLPEDLAQIAHRVNQLIHENAKTMRDLKRSRAEVDVFAARFQHFLNFMVESGMMTEEQYWSWALNWEESLKEQLRDVGMKVRRAIQQAQQQEAREVQQILTPPSPRLIVPGRE